MKRFAGSFAVVAVMLALTFPALAPASPTPERHPEIREAIESLRRAKDHLEHADHDFGGHRVEAMRATDEAIHQLEICLKYDRE
jgi:transcription elongation GreA/GreB family factor